MPYPRECAMLAAALGIARIVAPEPRPRDVIRQRRRALGWTGDELARRCAMYPTTVWAIEQGRLLARPAQWRRLLAALGLPPDTPP